MEAIFKKTNKLITSRLVVLKRKIFKNKTKEAFFFISKNKLKFVLQIPEQEWLKCTEGR